MENETVKWFITKQVIYICWCKSIKQCWGKNFDILLSVPALITDGLLINILHLAKTIFGINLSSLMTWFGSRLFIGRLTFGCQVKPERPKTISISRTVLIN